MLVAANFLFSLPIVVPVFLLIAQTSGGTLAARRMMADKLDINWVTDFINRQMPGASLESTGIQVMVLLSIMGLGYLLLNTLFAGGIIAVFASDDGRFTPRKFWWGCGAYFWRFFRLMLISVTYYLASYLLYYLARVPLERAVQRATAYESVVFKEWGTALLLVLLFGFVNMVSDYAKIGTVVNDSRMMFRESVNAWRFSLRHFFSAFGLYLLIGGAGMTIFISLAWLRNSINQGSIIAVLAAIMIGQLAIVARMWSRLMFYAAELNLYRRYLPRRAPIIAPVPDEKIEFLAATGGDPEDLGNDQAAEAPAEVSTRYPSARADGERE